MKKKSYKRLLFVLSGIFVIFVLILALLVMKEKKDNGKTEEKNLSSVEQQIQEEEAYIIETKYCDLCYPLKWEDNLSVKILIFSPSCLITVIITRITEKLRTF